MKWLQKQRIALSEAADLPVQIAAGLPQIAVDGFHQLSVDMQEGLLAYSETQIDVAVSLGKISVRGSGLRIRQMKERRIVLSGEITELLFSREAKP